MASVRLILPDDFIENPSGGTFTVTLSSIIYRMRLVWDNRANGDAGAWRWDWRTSDGTAVLLGRKVVLTPDTFRWFHHLDNVPVGTLRVFRNDGGSADPGLNDLGTSVELEYTV